MKGFRVVPLTSTGEIPEEVGKNRHFSSSLKRAEWWAERLPQEDVQYLPSAFDYAMYGYAIMVVEAENTQEDRFFPGGEDFVGRITSVQPVKVVRRSSLKRPSHKSWWRRILSKLRSS